MNIVKDTALFPYIEGLQLQGKDITLTIRNCILEKMQGHGGRTVEKPVLIFQETNKALVLNKTNAKTLVKLYGQETNDWTGRRVTLYAESVQAFGDLHLVVRIRPQSPPPVTQEQKTAGKQKAAVKVTGTNDDLFGDTPAATPPAASPVTNGSGHNGNGNGYHPAGNEPIDWTKMALAANDLDGFCAAAYQLHTAVFTNAVGVKNAYLAVIGDYGVEYNAAALDAIGVLANRLGDKVKKDEAISAAVRRFTELTTIAEQDVTQEPLFDMPDDAPVTAVTGYEE